MKIIELSSLILNDGIFYLSAMFRDSEKKVISYKNRKISDALALKWLKSGKGYSETLTARLPKRKQE